MWIHYYSWILVFLSSYMCVLTIEEDRRIYTSTKKIFFSNHEIGDLANIYPHIYVVMVFQQYLSYMMVVHFIGGGNGRTQRKPATCRKSLTNFITLCCIEYISPWTGFKLTTFVVICTNCTGSCKSNYHMIKTTMALCQSMSSFLTRN